MKLEGDGAVARFFQKLKMKSARTRLIALVASSFVVFILLLTLYSVYAVRMIRNQTAELNRNTIVLQCNTIDTLFSGANQYLIALSTLTEDMERIGRGELDTDTYLSRLRILQEFQSGHQQFSSIDGVFLYFPKTEEYITTSSASTDYYQRLAVKERIIQYLSKGLPAADGWTPLKAKGEYFFCRILQVGDGYLGVWSSVDTLLSVLKEPGIAQLDHVVFITDEGRILDSSSIFYEPGETEVIQNEEYLTLMGKRYIVSRCPSESGPFSLMALADEQRVLAGMTSLYRIIITLTFCLVLLMTVAASVLQTSFLAPLSTLVDAMNGIRSGDLDTQMKVPASGEEFRLAADTFNSMTREIKRLKMDIYEEKLLRQKTKQQYYQLQIKPHFFMNSLKRKRFEQLADRG